MTINERIRELRKEKHLTQVEFGERIGLKKSAANKIEQDGATVIDQNVRLICEAFGVNERWLRTGKGERDANDDAVLFEKIRERFHLYGLTEEAARAWFYLDDAERRRIAEDAERIASTLKAHMKEGQSPQRIDIDQEVADYRAELEAQEKGRSPSAGTSATEKRA